MLLTNIFVALSSFFIGVCNGLGHGYIAPENFEEFHNHLTEVKKREFADVILSEVGEHASSTKRFGQV